MANRIFNEMRNENLPPNRGPKLYKLNDKVISILTDRIADEYIAHYFYQNAANWCADMNYKKATEFFTKEANNELEHAQGLQKYMTDFNIIPEIPSVETLDEFTSLVDIIYKAYELEFNLMKSYNRDSQILFGEDITTFDFLTKYREGQKESVVEYNDLINALDLIDKNDKFQILYFEQTYM
jgi:ferritin